MALYRFFLLTSLIVTSLWANDARHVLFLMKSEEPQKAIEAYQEHIANGKKHNFEVLEEMGRILIEDGCESSDFETAMIGLYGVAMSNLSSAEHYLERAIKSPHPNVQLVALQLLSRMNKDSIDDVISMGMSSDFLQIRLETLHHLTARKTKFAMGHVDALMRMLPPPFRAYFCDFFARLDSPSATNALRDLLSDSELQVRLSALLTSARYSRDDLLTDVRTALTHESPAEKEAAAFAIGALGDSGSVEKLKKLSQSTYPSVKLAALVSRLNLGEEGIADQIKEMAKGGDLFAIQYLAHLPASEDLLYQLTQVGDEVVKLNAVMALLGRRDPRATAPLADILIRDMTDIGYMPIFSMGRSFVAWKSLPNAKQQDLEAVTLSIKENLLIQAMELPETAFVQLANEIFDRGQNSLIPLTVHLLENVKSDDAITMLEYNANRIGSPLIRGYSMLGLYRMGVSQPYREKFVSWINTQKGVELIRFRPLEERQLDLERGKPYSLTPEENSALLLESFEALARRHEKSSIDVILNAIKEGNPKNRPALGGLLLLALR